jgi:hypothetical protein
MGFRQYLHTTYLTAAAVDNSVCKHCRATCYSTLLVLLDALRCVQLYTNIHSPMKKSVFKNSGFARSTGCPASLCFTKIASPMMVLGARPLRVLQVRKVAKMLFLPWCSSAYLYLCAKHFRFKPRSLCWGHHSCSAYEMQGQSSCYCARGLASNCSQYSMTMFTHTARPDKVDCERYLSYTLLCFSSPDKLTVMLNEAVVCAPAFQQRQARSLLKHRLLSFQRSLRLQRN